MTNYLGILFIMWNNDALACFNIMANKFGKCATERKHKNDIELLPVFKTFHSVCKINPSQHNYFAWYRLKCNCAWYHLPGNTNINILIVVFFVVCKTWFCHCDSLTNKVDYFIFVGPGKESLDMISKYKTYIKSTVA